MVPHLNELHEKYEDKGLTVVGVTNEDRQLVVEKIKAVEMDFPVARVEGLGVDKAYQVSGVPKTFLIDRQGQVVWYGHPAALPDEKVLALLE